METAGLAVGHSGRLAALRPSLHNTTNDSDKKEKDLEDCELTDTFSLWLKGPDDFFRRKESTRNRHNGMVCLGEDFCELGKDHTKLGMNGKTVGYTE